eukprot:1974762-Prymnesium_polylepis.1
MLELIRSEQIRLANNLGVHILRDSVDLTRHESLKQSLERSKMRAVRIGRPPCEPLTARRGITRGKNVRHLFTAPRGSRVGVCWGHALRHKHDSAGVRRIKLNQLALPPEVLVGTKGRQLQEIGNRDEVHRVVLLRDGSASLPSLA